jgi:hypothetical protein
MGGAQCQPGLTARSAPPTLSAMKFALCGSPLARKADDVIDGGKDPAAKALGAKGAKKRAESMTPERRAEIAKKAAESRWRKSD